MKTSMRLLIFLTDGATFLPLEYLNSMQKYICLNLSEPSTACLLETKYRNTQQTGSGG